jgi:hypothetical protein
MGLNNMNKKIHIIKGMLGINSKLVGEWLLFHIEKWDTSQSLLDWKG